MGILETLRGKIGSHKINQQDFEAQLRSASQRREDEKARKSSEEVIAYAQAEQQWKQAKESEQREYQKTILKLSDQANKLFRPKLETIKKVYAKGKGDIELNISTDQGGRPRGASLTLIWNRQTIPPVYGINDENESHEETHFFLGTDGEVEFKSWTHVRYMDWSNTPSNLRPDSVKVNIKDKNWQSKIAEKIPEILQC